MEHIDNTQEGTQRITLEINHFFDLLLFGCERARAMFPGLKIDHYDNHHLHGGRNLEFNGSTLVSQYSHATSANDTPHLTLSLYNLRFNKDGQAIGENGLPVKIDNIHDLMMFRRYQLYQVEGGKYKWMESTTEDRGWDSAELVGIWLNYLLEKKVPELNQN